jgi:hypothetical protein
MSMNERDGDRPEEKTGDEMGEDVRIPDEFQRIWKAYDVKLERSLQLNLRLLEEVQTQKARSVLRSLVIGRIFGIVIGMVYGALLCVALYYVWSQPVMAVSFGVFILCTAIAIGKYIEDIAVIRRISYADNIVNTQEKLAKMQSSIIRTLRVSWLQLPFWATFFVSNKLLHDGGRGFLVYEAAIVVLFTLLAIFLYRNITVENAGKKKWVMGMIRGSGIRSVSRAIGHMKEIEDFKREQ